MATVPFETLPRELAEMQAQIEDYARDQGLDFFPTLFEIGRAHV